MKATIHKLFDYLLETTAGERLWLFYGRGGAVTDGWYCEGRFG